MTRPITESGALTRFRIRQNGMTVAGAEGPNAEAEIWRYAFQCRQEGDLTIQFDAGGYWKRFALLVHWPATPTEDHSDG